MPFRKYTQCYVHTPGDKPFHEDDLVGLALIHGVAPGALFGALTGLAVGFLAGGPIGAIIGIFAGISVGIATALTEAANRWRYHRLVCLTGVQCAVGIVREDPTRGDLGAFDNDEFFDLQLMPHPIGDKINKNGSEKFAYDYAGQSDNYKATPPTPAPLWDATANANLLNHPKNDVLTDGFQGSDLVRPSITDLPYDTSHNWIHCEAEGDFWQRVTDFALALGMLAALLAIATGAAAVGGGIAGAAIGCAIGGIFGPIGCLIGAILGAILGALLAGGAAAAISYAIIKAILQAIFDAHPGDVEDANIGDAALGPIRVGDHVVAYGEHVYDGFHEGWHELHPLMAIIKLADKKMNSESDFYLEWNPNFGASDPLPPDLPDMPSSPPNQDITHLTADDMRQGLDSDKFTRRAKWLQRRWCGMLNEAFSDGVRQNQQGLTERWTVHPLVDGCVSEEEGSPYPRIHSSLNTAVGFFGDATGNFLH